MMKDKNGKEMRTGDIVKVGGAYTKRHNGYFVIEHTPGDVSWLGEDYSLQRLKKNGEYSNGSYTTQFWPLCYFSNNIEHNAAAREHDSKNATIEIVGNINTEFIVAHFEEESKNSMEQAKVWEWQFGEDSETTKKAIARAEHYKKVVEYIKEKGDMLISSVSFSSRSSADILSLRYLGQQPCTIRHLDWLILCGLLFWKSALFALV